MAPCQHAQQIRLMALTTFSHFSWPLVFNLKWTFICPESENTGRWSWVVICLCR